MKNSDKSSVSDTPYSQRLPRPLRYPPSLLHSPLFFLSLATAVVLVIAGVIIFSYQESNHAHLSSIAKNTPTAISTPTPTLIPTPTPTAISTPVPTLTIPTTPAGILTWATSGQPFINDRLQSQDGNGWSEIPNSVRSCQFSGGTYHASASFGDSYAPCLALTSQDSNLQNIAFQVQATIIKGDAGGLVFHSNASGANNYSFTFCIVFTCGQGFYGLHIAEGQHYTHIISGPSTAIKTKLNQTNVLTVVALTGDIYLYINSQNVAHVHDNTLNSGYIGVTAYEQSNSTDVSFSNAQVWKL